MYQPRVEALEDRLAPGDLLNTSMLWRVDGFLSNADLGSLADQPLAAAGNPAGQATPGSEQIADTPPALAGSDGAFVDNLSGPSNPGALTNDYSWAAYMNASGLPSGTGGATVAGLGVVFGTVTENYCARDEKFGFGYVGTRGASGVDVYLYQPDGALYYTVTAGDGSFAFEGVPAGFYYALAYVGVYGQAWAPVTVDAGGVATTSMHLPFAVPGEMLASYVAGTTDEQITALEEAYGLTRIRIFLGGTYYYRMAEGSFTTDTIAAYAAESIVRFAEPNSIACLL